MAIFKSGNPTLQEKSFEGTIFQGISTGQEMTVKGTMNKFGFLLIMVMGATIFAWGQFYKGSNPMPFMMIGVFGGLALAIVMMIKKSWSPYIAPAYALLQGLFVGAVSAYYDYLYPGLVMQAVGLTLVVTLLMYLIYRYKIIKVTSQFKMVIIIA